MPAVGGPAAEPLDERRIRGRARPDERAATSGSGAMPAQRLEQQVLPLVRDHGADAEQPAAAGRAGCFLAEVRAGPGDLHPLRGEPVAVEQPLAGSRSWS